jgi:hypothetical protein
MIFYDMIKKKIVLHKFFSIKKVFWRICTKLNSYHRTSRRQPYRVRYINRSKYMRLFTAGSLVRFDVMHALLCINVCWFYKSPKIASTTVAAEKGMHVH